MNYLFCGGIFHTDAIDFRFFGQLRPLRIACIFFIDTVIGGALS